MRFYYGEQNILRALDEAEFWKHQEAEHTKVIRIVTPDLEQQYRMRLERFGNEFHKTYGELVKLIESVIRSGGTVSHELRTQMLALIKYCLKQSKEFIELMEDMLVNSHAVRSSMPSQTLINHMIRESQYFIGIDQLILS